MRDLRRKTSRISPKAAKIIAIAVFIVILAGMMIHISVTRHYRDISEREGTKVTAYVISSCVDDILASEKDTARQLVSITYGEDGKVRSVETDPAAVNRIQSRILREVNSALSDNEALHVKLPVGTLTDNSFLTGRGPEIELVFDQKGSATVTLENKLISGGINQTVYRVYARIDADIYSVSPFDSVPIHFSFDYLLSETVIVGDIPESYFQCTPPQMSPAESAAAYRLSAGKPVFLPKV